MNRRWMITAIALAAAATLTYVQANPEPANPQAAKLDNTTEKMSYIIGMNMGREFKQNYIDINVAALNRGLNDGMAGKQSALSEEQVQATLLAVQQEIAEKMEKAAEQNLVQGQAFLEANKQKEGVVTLDSGLQYKVLQSGEGEKPQLTDTVTVHYRGSLIDDTEFETSVGGEPLTISVQSVIPGWVEALQLMSVGDKWQLFIPAELGYGPRGGPGGPNAVLIFEVELLSIQK